ncbi:hypothetical protein SASPL_153441 [Salvia splendens]|uniref:F-box domain-containing protein n=1 Tax=Salvia splendens TaxID=180675 RepID=A0A8X8W588_SALSN|nr:F-box/FBD/LRR-repeat protein At3g51530-like [Salvia splendens]KAG6388240.1 hypothetical protein SASPL_153441 [Salvia splendens]
MEGERDRMSQLPDDILLLILGKMDTFEAAKTTILSNRWKNLWRLVPNLRFHLSCIGHHVCDLEDLAIRFSHLVSRCLSHCDSAAAVHDFHLSLDVPRYSLVDDEFLDEIVEECVLYAINHDVQSISVHTNRSLTLPVSCKTLRELDLRQSYVYVPGRLSLPNLKTLYLETELCFHGKDNKMEPFSGLPELEKLTLIGSFIYGLVIKAPKLRVLEITTHSVVKEIYTPLLTSFRYESDRAWECATVNLPMLEQVYLDIHETRPWYNYRHRIHFVRMLHQFESATTVSLTLDTLRVPFSLFLLIQMYVYMHYIVMVV